MKHIFYLESVYYPGGVDNTFYVKTDHIISLLKGI